MEYPINHRGGGRVGYLHASWPLVTLRASRDEIVLDMGMREKYKFTPEKVIAIEKYGNIPLFSSGVQIKHTIMEYPEKVIFSGFKSPEKIIAEIHDIGFIPKASSTEIRERSGLPMRWEVLLIIAVAWNLLFMMEFGFNIFENKEVTFGPFIFIATFSIFIFSICSIKFKPLQNIILKPGRNIEEMRGELYLILLVSGVFALASFVGTIFKYLG